MSLQCQEDSDKVSNRSHNSNSSRRSRKHSKQGTTFGALTNKGFFHLVPKSTIQQERMKSSERSKPPSSAGSRVVNAAEYAARQF